MAWMRGVAMELQRIGGYARTGVARAAGADDVTDHRDDLEGGDADDDDDAMTIRSKPTTLKACRDLVAEIAGSVDHHLPEGDAPDDVLDLHGRLVEVTRRSMNVLSTRKPPAEETPAQFTDDQVTHADLGPPRGWSDIDEGNIDECQRRLGAVRTRLDEALAATEASCRSDERGKWRDWIHEGLEAGAGRAHAYSRTPTEWVPTVTKKEGGAFSSTPDAILDSQRNKYKGY